MPIIQINDTNHTGLIADITFKATNGVISSLGSHQIPYVFDSGSNDYFGTYKLYYPQYNQTCKINYPQSLVFIVDSTICSTFTFDIGGNTIFEMNIDWGDGSPIENFNGNTGYIPTHDYSPLQNVFTVTISIDNPSTISYINSSPTYGYGCGNLLEIYNFNLLNSINEVYLSNNRLSSNSINNILISLSGTSYFYGIAILNNQTPIACPTGLAIDAQEYLETSRFWNIQTDYFCEPLLEITIDANINQSVYFAIGNYVSSINFKMTIDWGDGSPLNSYYNSGFHYPSYNYPNPGIYTAKFGFSKINGVEYIQEGGYFNVTSLNNFNLLTNLYYVQFQNNRLSSSTINEILITLSGNGISSGQAYLNNQTPPACPTGLGIDAYYYLINNLGWYIDVYICPFISIWRTTSPNETIYLPIYDGGNYNFFVDWGDGNFETITSYTTNSHTYASAGDYTISISGLIEGWNFGQTIYSRSNLIEIISWGSLQFGMYLGDPQIGGYFYLCPNLVLTGVTDVPNLYSITSFNNMFAGCTSITTINNIENWDVSNIQYMGAMFAGSQFNQDISGWNVSNVQSMLGMFQGATQFNQNIGSWNVSGVTNMIFMFSGATQFNQDISSWNVSNVVDMYGMFKNATQFNQDLSIWCVSGITDTPTDFDTGASSWTGGTATRPQWGQPC